MNDEPPMKKSCCRWIAPWALLRRQLGGLYAEAGRRRVSWHRLAESFVRVTLETRFYDSQMSHEQNILVN